MISSVIRNVVGGVATSLIDKSAKNDAFIMTWDTEGVTPGNKTVTVPAESGAFDAIIDWGDGSTSNITSSSDPDLEHTYSSAGVYDISITGAFPWFRFNNGGDKLLVTNIKNWGDIGTLNLNGTFNGCANMTCTAVDVPNWSNVTNGLNAFRGCSVFNGEIGSADTSGFTTMATMLHTCAAFNRPLTGWDTSSVEDMSSMLQGCSRFNQPLSHLNTGAVANMSFMLLSCPAFDQDISTWDVEAVTNLTSFLGSGTLSTANYDALLIAWEAQEVNPNLSVSFGLSKYTPGGAAEAARTELANAATNNWTIVDGGAA